eukprot:SAG31_NODE_489_length_14938_cov_5.644113_12_plen_63_part_00
MHGAGVSDQINLSAAPRGAPVATPPCRRDERIVIDPYSLDRPQRGGGAAPRDNDHLNLLAGT